MTYPTLMPGEPPPVHAAARLVDERASGRVEHLLGVQHAAPCLRLGRARLDQGALGGVLVAAPQVQRHGRPELERAHAQSAPRAATPSASEPVVSAG